MTRCCRSWRIRDHHVQLVYQKIFCHFTWRARETADTKCRLLYYAQTGRRIVRRQLTHRARSSSPLQPHIAPHRCLTTPRITPMSFITVRGTNDMYELCIAGVLRDITAAARFRAWWSWQKLTEQNPSSNLPDKKRRPIKPNQKVPHISPTVRGKTKRVPKLPPKTASLGLPRKVDGA